MTVEKSQPARFSFRSIFPAPFVFAIVFFGGLFVLSCPRPFFDDLYYIGAALNLATGGDFSNPLVARQDYPGVHHFFGHPPLYSYVLAGWLKLFGISARSLEAFQGLMYLSICRATLAIFRRHQVPRVFEWLLPFVIASSFLNIGLRFEPLSVALTMTGFALIDCGCASPAGIFLSFLLIFSGGSTASRITFFSAGLALLAFWQLHQRKISIVKLGLLAGSALLIVWFLFLWMIGFNLHEYWTTYLIAAHGRSGGPMLDAIRHYLFHIQGITWLPVHLLWLISLPWALMHYKNELGRIALALILPVFAMIAIGALNDGAIWYIELALLASVALLSQTSPRVWARTAQVLVIMAVLAANCRYGIGLVGVVTGHDGSGPNDNLAEARALQPSPGRAVLIDYDTARYVFDYRIPSGCLAWEFSTAFPGSLAIESPPHPGDICLLGPGIVELIERSSRLDLPVPKYKLFGSEKWGFFEYPRAAYIIDPNAYSRPAGNP